MKQGRDFTVSLIKCLVWTHITNVGPMCCAAAASGAIMPSALDRTEIVRERVAAYLNKYLNKTEMMYLNKTQMMPTLYDG